MCISLFYMHCDLQHHHHAMKVAKMAPMAHPSKDSLPGAQPDKKKVDLQLRKSLKLPDHPAKAMESDLEVFESENKSDVEFNRQGF